MFQIPHAWTLMLSHAKRVQGADFKCVLFCWFFASSSLPLWLTFAAYGELFGEGIAGAFLGSVGFCTLQKN